MSECQTINCCEESIYGVIDIPDPLPIDTDADIIVSASPSGGGTAESSQTVPLGSSVTVTATPSADILTVDVGVDVMLMIDESGSSATTILTWIDAMLADLSNSLLAAGIGSGTIANRYALVGFGCGPGSHHTTAINYPAGLVPTAGAAHKHFVGGGDWGTIAEAQTAIALFDPSGADTAYPPPSEDVYAALAFASTDYTWRSDVPKIIVFFTDEDRNQWVYNTGATQIAQFANMKASLLTLGAHVAGVMGLQCVKNEGGYPRGLGIDVTGKIWMADGVGGFTTDTNGITAAEVNDLPFDYGTMEAATSTSVTDTGKSWTSNQWSGDRIRLLSGAGAGQIRQIATNTATKITTLTPWTTTPAAGDEYQIETANAYTDPQFPTGTKSEYYDLIVNAQLNGTAWDVGKLFGADAVTLSSFSSALVDSIASNIVEQLQWIFIGWYEDGVLVSTDLSYTFIANDDRDLVARFTRTLI